MYTHIEPTTTGCYTDQEGFHACTNCAFYGDPLGCDGFCATEHAQKETKEA